MSRKTIDGRCYAKMLFGGAAFLAAHAQELNDMNVFPVSDGDTGTNMLKTIEGGLAGIDNGLTGIGELSELFSKKILLSARGNSGVILSQIFAGINEGLCNYEDVNAYTLAKAYKKGIAKSYGAVQNPAEGTILTVFRESTEYALEKINEQSTVEDFFRMHIEQAERSLAETKEILPALAEAEVVDSGAAGYLCIAQGMFEALGGKAIAYKPSETSANNEINIDLFTRDSKLEFGYCTELLMRLTTEKVDPDTFSIDTVTEALKELGGESVVAYKQDDVVKIHVHTFTPGKIMNKMQEFGEFLTVKVENMSIGHSEAEKTKNKNKERKKGYSVVAVASGEGISALFMQMGADYIVSGGQTSNPAIEDFVEAFEKCPTEEIIVLPNNKNIILAAKQATEIYNDAKIHIVETKNLMQGYGALSVITPGIKDIKSLLESADRAAKGIIDGEITAAVRNATVEGTEIECGDYMAFSGGKLVAVEKTPEEAVLKMLESSDTDLCEIISLFAGKNVTDEARVEITGKLRELYSDCEIIVYTGGQDVYEYLVAVE